MSQGSDKLHSIREEKARMELHRVRNTFSFRLGLLLTESFIRKPWLLPLLPFRLLGLFFYQRKPYKSKFSLPNREINNGSILLFSASEEGMAAIERCESLSNKYLLEGKKVVNISTSIHANRLTDDDIVLFTLPDPKAKTNLNTREWNDTCLDLFVSIIESNDIGTIIFDGPYPYRGILNAFEIYPGIHTIWRRPAYSPATNVKQIELFDCVETDWLDSYDKSDYEVQPFSNKDQPLNLLMGLGYNKRNGIAKRTPAIISQLKRLPKMQIAMPEHLGITESALGTTIISRWDNISNNSELRSLDAAIIPPEPQLIQCLTGRHVPTLVVTSGNLEKSKITELRKLSHEHPLLVLDDPDGEDLRLALGTLVSGTMQAGNILPRI